MAKSPHDISGLGLAELKALLVQALEENARLKAENQELREEIARLKGLKGRPKLRPSGMEQASEARDKGSRQKGRRGAKRAKLTIHETRIVKADTLPEGARFKGYEDFVVQDIIIKPHTVLYRRERWLLPSGETVVAAQDGDALGDECDALFAANRMSLAILASRRISATVDGLQHLSEIPEGRRLGCHLGASAHRITGKAGTRGEPDRRCAG